MVDFELLFRYMFQAQDNPEWEHELEYLFGHTDTTFILGPGTRIEIDRFLKARGLQVYAHGEVRKINVGQDIRIDPQTRFAVVRLAGLLKLDHVEPYVYVVESGRVHDPAYQVALAALDKRRRRASTAANQADALNWAAVVHLRRHINDLALGYYPYLLTWTRPLLDERLWSDEIGSPISRSPPEAVYTEVLFDVVGDNPQNAMDHTVRMSFDASLLERDLKSSPASLRPLHYSREPQWERVVAEGRVGHALRAQLHDLAHFVSDPVIRETQRLFDNARVSAISAVPGASEELAELSEAPGRLFDLIVGINAALNASQPGSAGLAGLWTTVLEVHETHLGDVTEFVLTDSGGSSQYLAVECHVDPASPPLLVFRWPSSSDVVGVVQALSDALQHHGAALADACVGVPGRILSFEVDLPLRLADLADAVNAELAESTEAAASFVSMAYGDQGGAATELVAEIVRDSASAGAKIAWLRLDTQPMDVYVDVTGRPPGDPLVGVFVDDVDVEQIVELYSRTSAHYIFPTWLREAVQHILARCRVGDA